jgi:hypothetical protein
VADEAGLSARSSFGLKTQEPGREISPVFQKGKQMKYRVVSIDEKTNESYYIFETEDLTEATIYQRICEKIPFPGEKVLIEEI